MPDKMPGFQPTQTTDALTKEQQDQQELLVRREYILARIKTDEGGNPTIAEARALGVPESELKDYAFLFLTKDIKEGYGLDTVRSIAEQSGVVTRMEIDALFASLKVAKESAAVVVETEDEKNKKAAADAAWLEEMLKMCGE